MPALPARAGSEAGLRGMHGVYQQLLATATLGAEVDQEMNALCRWAFLVQWAVALLENASRLPAGGSAIEAAIAAAAAKGKKKPAAKGRRTASTATMDDDDEDDDRRAALAAAPQTWAAQKEALVVALLALLKLPLNRVFHVTTERDALISCVARGRW